MAPTDEHGAPPGQTLSLWDLLDSLFKHPGLLFGASTIILGVFAARRSQHSIRRQHEQQEPLDLERGISDQKQDSDHLSLSDLPPPLQSVLTSSILAEGLTPGQRRLIPSDPLPYQRQYVPDSAAPSSTSASRPWRRHSYHEDSPTTEITADETSYYPIFDDDGNRKPERWRRRTLVFEMQPAVDEQTRDTGAGTAPVLQKGDSGIGLALDGDVDEAATHDRMEVLRGKENLPAAND